MTQGRKHSEKWPRKLWQFSVVAYYFRRTQKTNSVDNFFENQESRRMKKQPLLSSPDCYFLKKMPEFFNRSSKASHSAPADSGGTYSELDQHSTPADPRGNNIRTHPVQGMCDTIDRCRTSWKKYQLGTFLADFIRSRLAIKNHTRVVTCLFYRCRWRM